jgi:hypothetical protein
MESNTPTPAPPKLLVDSRTAAKMLSISPRTLWSLTAPRGPIRSVRFGRALRYAVRDLEAAIEGINAAARGGAGG